MKLSMGDIRVLKPLLVGVMLVGALGVGLTGCDDDMPTDPTPPPEETPDTDPDPNVFCDNGLCMGNDALRNECIEKYNTCILANPEENEDECAAVGLLTCGIEDGLGGI